MFTLRELAVFLAVAENGSFSGAAQALHLSQPSVSQAVKNLENQVGSELFVRSLRGVSLTDLGASFLPMAHELITCARRVEENVALLNGTVAGRVLIGCSTSAGKYLLPRLIAGFRQQFPQVRADVLVKSRETVYERLVGGQVHFGVASRRFDHSALEILPFFEDEIVLIVPAAHPWAGYGRVYPDDLLDAPLILRETTSGTTESLFQALREHDITPDMLKVVMELGNAEAIVMAVEEGIGAAFVSRLVARRDLAHGSVVEVAVEGMRLQRQLFIARNLHVPFTPPQAEFWRYLAAHPAAPAPLERRPHPSVRVQT